MNTASHYDVVIIGAGMSGLAAGIRLAHFGQKVCIFERHNTVGGLNSFYSIGGRKFDVGLHAMTNFVPRGVKGTPLGKLLRQLRIDRDEFDLSEQRQSRVAFPGVDLRFTNDFAVFESEVGRAFPAQRDGFQSLLREIRAFDEVALDAKAISAREVVGRHLSDPLLVDMIFCPLMFYGSAQERDMDFGQFVIMFKSIFLEGFARPLDGVRVILRVLMDKYRQAGGERRMKCGVSRIIAEDGRAARLILDDGGEVTATHVLSSIGAPETAALLAADSRFKIEDSRSEIGAPRSGIQDLKSKIQNPKSPASPAAGRLSFVETISILDREPADLGWGSDTIVFFNDHDRFDYVCPSEPVDPRSGVICLPNNFQYGEGRRLPEGVFRVTCLASYDRWVSLPEDVYQADKQRWFAAVTKSARRFLPPLADGALAAHTVTTDMFTPRTVRKYTGHLNGAIYGAPQKIRDGRTPLQNLYLCGTDQGFLGIVGAMLSGISMANYHILQGAK
jgi:phytoene dehydrogenase-like protein